MKHFYKSQVISYRSALSILHRERTVTWANIFKELFLARQQETLMDVLNLNNVTKTFGGFCAVNDLSFSIAAGSMYGLLGPNGAGKTTTIRMIMDIIVPDRGEIEILGKGGSSEIRDRVGYLPEERGLYRKMKLGQLLLFFGQMKGLRKNETRGKIDYWLERFDLSDWKQKKVEELSRGMQQKLQFITTIFHEPELIILDEPFAGLDPLPSFNGNTSAESGRRALSSAHS